MAKELVKPTKEAALLPLVDLKPIIDMKKQLDKYIRDGLKLDRDYGTIQGTNKPTLYKPGAEQVLSWFNCFADIEILSEQHDHHKPIRYKYWNANKQRYIEGETKGFHSITIKVLIRNRNSGNVVGSGIGTCSTMESKFISRPNDSENTVTKIAKKRALVDGVLSTFGLSDRFTQDVEDHSSKVNIEPMVEDPPKPKPVHKPRKTEDKPAPETVQGPVKESAADDDEVGLKDEITDLLFDLAEINNGKVDPDFVADLLQAVSYHIYQNGKLYHGVRMVNQLKFKPTREGSKVSQAKVVRDKLRKLKEDGTHVKTLIEDCRHALSATS